MDATTSQSTADAGGYNIFRLKQNPSWIKFGLPAGRGGGTVHDVSVKTPPSLQHVTSAGWSAHRSSVGGRTSTRPPAGPVNHAQGFSPVPTMPQNVSFSSSRPSVADSRVDSLVAAGTQAALRYEQRQHQHQHEPSVKAVDTHSSRGTPSFSLAHDNRIRVAFETPSPSSCASQMRSSVSPATALVSQDHTNALKQHIRDTEKTLAIAKSPSQSCGLSRDDSVSSKPSPAPTRTGTETSRRTTSASQSRAAVHHLSGSAAVVEAAGPMDALYVPLRRPAPRECEAVRQHFSIFDTEKEGRSGKALERTEPGNVQRARTTFRADPFSTQPSLSSWTCDNTYQTSNSVYGHGC